MAKFKLAVKDKGWKAIASTAKKYAGLKGRVAVVGVQANDAGRDEEGPTNVLLATVHEFGSPSKNIPERSFLRWAFNANRKKYEKELERIAALGSEGKDIDGEMMLLAEQFRADIIKRFDSNIPPPAQRQLAEVKPTRRGKKKKKREIKAEEARKNDPTLHDTGQLRDSISAVVKTMGQAGGGKT